LVMDGIKSIRFPDEAAAPISGSCRVEEGG
jgi:hypothetical protein